jgi:hypothetical protein
MIENSIRLGDPVEHGGIVIAPLFPRQNPVAEYLTLEEALPLGFQITEVDSEGSVPELLASNPLETPVLLFDGEELIGLKQNRILDVTVLVAANAETRIPVSCVEQGRWHADSASLEPARHAAYPDLRRRKAARLSAQPLARGAAQAAVWEEVAAKVGRLGVHSRTLAAADIYGGSDSALSSLRRAFPLAPGQSGAVLALGNDQLCLDYASQPAAFANLYPKLLEGYLLDGLEHLHDVPAKREVLAEFITAVAALPQRMSPSAGLGDDLRITGADVLGSGLIMGQEMVQLSAFTYEPSAPRTRVSPPSDVDEALRSIVEGGEVPAETFAEAPAA